MIELKRYSIPLLLIAAMVGVVLLSPDERTLGSGIKAVYVHVMFIVTGRIGLTIAGLMGVTVVATGNPRWQRWASVTGWMALALFAIGIATSMIAAEVNWGGVFLDEPRMKASMQVAAVVLIAQVLTTWTPNIRLRGLLHVAAAGFLTWTLVRTQLVMHPRGPVLESDAFSIQMTFFILMGLCTLVTGWVVWQVCRRPSNAAK